ncbi:hypothetical protein AQF52_4576 [Streptomyces venezuelae]|nr:hypothetical protein AQF52_4576 [Streptomyces venezuelae]CUM39379.1 hypothetical protein BN2537_7723 [Streptomyces venezuelae]
MGNHLARHPSLSAAAIGLGVYIQSLPEGADVTSRLLLSSREVCGSCLARAAHHLRQVRPGVPQSRRRSRLRRLP